MSITIEATYEEGVLKPDKPLELPEHHQVLVTIHPGKSLTEEGYGLLRFTRDPKIIKRVAEGDEFSQLASNDMDFDRVPGLTRYSPK